MFWFGCQMFPLPPVFEHLVPSMVILFVEAIEPLGQRGPVANMVL